MPASGDDHRPGIGALSAERRQLLERLHAERGTAGSDPRPRPDPTAAVPLSYAQEQIWVMDRLLGPAAMTATPLTARLRGRLDLDALRSAVTDLVARHEALRTSFDVVDGEPAQLVRPEPSVDFAVEDLAGQPPAACAEAAAAVLRAGFDLRDGPLLRVRVYQLAADDHVLLVARHHIIFDQQSDQIFLRELRQLYAQHAGGSPAALPELPVQYPDFAHWQRQWLTGQRLAGLLDHWRQVLDGAPIEAPAPVCPPPRQPAPQQVCFLSRRIPEPVVAGLAALARQEQLTPFMVLLTLLRIAILHHSGEDDVLVGVPVSGRSRPVTQELIGCFLNMLVLRGDLAGDPTVRELARRERDRVLAAYDHQELPYALLAQRVRRSGGGALFALSFSHESGSAWAPPVHLDGLTSEPFDIDGATTPHDLNVKVIQDGAGATIHWAYRADRCDGQAVSRLAEHYLACVSEAASHPDRPARQLAPDTARPATAAAVAGEPAPDRLPVVSWGDETDPDPPAGPIEELIADLWGELLGSDPPGTRASFFQAGGHSLMAVKLAYRLEETFGLPVAVADLLEHPTIAAQAELIERGITARFAELGADAAGALLDTLADSAASSTDQSH